MEQLEDIRLMMLVRRDNTRAFELIHERYQHKLLNFFFALSRDDSTSNDLCQETFLRVWKIRKRYRATGAFGGYIFGVARMIWYERQRRRQRQQRLGLRCSDAQAEQLSVAPHLHPDAAASTAEINSAIFAAIDELPENQRMVFILRNIEGLSLDEIALALDCPRNTVRSRKILAVKKLRHLLKPLFEGDAPRSEEEPTSHVVQTLQP